MDDDQLAKVGYEAYGNFTGRQTWNGLPMPDWFDLGERIQKAWVAAAHEISILAKRYFFWRIVLNDREKKQVEFAVMYAKHFSHGATGHNDLLLIAKLATLLDGHFDDTARV